MGSHLVKESCFFFLSFYFSIFSLSLSLSLSLFFSFLSLHISLLSNVLIVSDLFQTCFRPVLQLLLTTKYLMLSTRRVIRTSLNYTRPLYEEGYQNKKQILHSGCKVRVRSAFAARVSCLNFNFLLTFSLTCSTLLSFFAQEMIDHGI